MLVTECNSAGGELIPRRGGGLWFMARQSAAEGYRPGSYGLPDVREADLAALHGGVYDEKMNGSRTRIPLPKRDWHEHLRF